MATARERHPQLFEKPSRESCRGKTKTVPLECLSLGFMRTGTFTMSAALEILGLHCWHSLLFFTSNLGDCEMWQEALNRKYFNGGDNFGRKEFDQLLHNFGAISADTPAIAFSEELISAYPEAKVILVERDIDKWYESFNEVVIKHMNQANKLWQWSPINWLFVYLNPSYIGLIGLTNVNCIRGWMGAYNTQQMREKAKTQYREHYALVRRVTPKERLLEFRLEEGWEPLCKFLGKPIPDQPFPRVNDREWLDEHMRVMIAEAAKRKVKEWTPFVIATVMAVLAWYWYGHR